MNIRTARHHPLLRNRPARLAALPLAVVAAVALAAARLPDAHGQSAPAPAAPAATPMDQPIALLEPTRALMGRVADYECTLVKHERVRGKLLPEQVASVKARRQPYSVYLRFEAPESVRGQQVCYVEGRNKGFMRVHPVGWRGIAGFVSLDIRDPRAFEDNRHPITEAALWSLIDTTARNWEMERRVNKTRVRVEDRTFQNRPCFWIETTHPEPDAAAYYAYRCVICIDKETRLPVRVEAYDRPRRGGPAGGDLLECYSYLGLRCNVGLGDRAFDF